ncbi:MAG: APC family permease [Cyanobacteriota bacterium]
MIAPTPQLRRCLGGLEITSQAVATIGLTLTAVINIPEAARSAGHATAVCYLLALAAILLVAETLVLFRRLPGEANGIAAYVGAGLGDRPGALAAWALLLGYGGTMLACLVFFGSYLDHLLGLVGLASPPPLLGFIVGGVGCLALARRDVRFSTGTMLATESLSVLIVLGLCVLVLFHGGPQADRAALAPLGDTTNQIRSGLMVAVLSFIGFESAATLGAESLRPERDVPRAIRISVLLAGLLFLIWAVVLTEGLTWLPPADRTGVDPIADLADRLGWAGGGEWIRAGAFLCLFGSTLGSLNALGRVAFDLAQSGVLPQPLARVHPRFLTPATALLVTTVPLMLIGVGLELRRKSVSEIFDQLGGFAVLAFLLVYGMVALAALRHPLPGTTRLRRLLVAGGSLVAVLAIGLGYLSTAIGSQNQMLATFLILLAVGGLLVLRSPRSDPRELSS